MSDLLQLPPEILLHISTFLGPVEFGALRLSCKAIEQLLFTPFAATFFRKRRCMLEQVSLDALVNIANHKHLARYVTEVVVSTRRFMNTDMQADIWPGHMNHDNLLATGTARDMLSAAFSKLVNLSIIGLRDYDSTLGGPGVSPYGRPWGWSYSTAVDHARNMEWMQTPSKALVLVLVALSSANARPRSLEVILRKKPKIKPNHISIPSQPTMRDSLRRMLSEIKTLKLTLDFMGDWTVTRHNMYSERFSVQQFLLETKSLEALRLNFTPSDENACIFLEWFAAKCSNLVRGTQAPGLSIPESIDARMPALSVLEVGKVTLNRQVLLNLLLSFDLVSFSLWEILLERPLGGGVNVWSLFLRELAVHLAPTSRIHTIMIGRISQVFGRMRGPGNDHVHFVKDVAKDADRKNLNRDQVDTEVKFTAGHAGVGVHQWLEALSVSAVVLLPTAASDTEESSGEPSDNDPEEGSDESEDSDI